ncbi:hypothetical protein [Sphingosinithalassobacter portus]|uniref:hypothetical protein n=1 Tax=Stakelama portus TaxID=2676234 RepID=UPI000D6E36DB|nr:hypothetical protein [Sphingosinithalassobacter portus]
MKIKTLIACALSLGGFAAATASAQSARTNMYNANGVDFHISTANFENTYELTSNWEVKYNGRLIGTWLQASDGVESHFFIAIGKNEVAGGRNDMIVYSGEYVVSSGDCKIRRISADANGGITGECTITPK